MLKSSNTGSNPVGGSDPKTRRACLRTSQALFLLVRDPHCRFVLVQATRTLFRSARNVGFQLPHGPQRSKPQVVRPRDSTCFLDYSCAECCDLCKCFSTSRKEPHFLFFVSIAIRSCPGEDSPQACSQRASAGVPRGRKGDSLV